MRNALNKHYTLPHPKTLLKILKTSNHNKKLVIFNIWGQTCVLMNQHSPIIYLNKNKSTANERVFFNKKELGQVLNLYGKMVSAGLWRDYSLEEGIKTISFNAYKRTSDQPAYKIIKSPHLANKQGAYAVIGQGGVTLKRGHELDTMLKYFNKQLIKAID